MNLSKQMMSVVSCLALVSVVGCNESSTEPYAPRTHSVVTTASVPSTPTAPITVATNEKESKVSLTLDVSTQQAIVALVGGPAQVKLTDVAPADYSNLPSGERSFVQSTDGAFGALVLEVSRTTASAALLRSLVAPGLKDQSATGYPVPIRFYYTPPSAALKIPAGTVDVYLTTNGTSFSRIGTLTITADVPQLISGTIFLPFTSARMTIVFVSRRASGAGS